MIVTPLSEQDKPQQLHEENLHSGLSEQGAAIDPQQEAQLQALFDEINQVSGEYAYEQGYATRMAMPGRVNFDLDAALAGNKAIWNHKHSNDSSVYGSKSAVVNALGNTITVSGLAAGATEVVPSFSLYSQGGGLKQGSAYMAHLAATSSSPVAYTGKLGTYAPGANGVLASYSNSKVAPLASQVGKALGVGAVFLDAGLGAYEIKNEFNQTGSVRASTVTYNTLKVAGSAAAFTFTAPVALGIGAGWAAANYFGADSARSTLQSFMD